MAKILEGKPVAGAISERLKPRIAACKTQGVTPTLAIIRVGERADDLSYERGAIKRCETLGINCKTYILDVGCSQEELMATIDVVNADTSVHACLMFRPLPKHLDEVAACKALNPSKDADGITQASLYGVFANQRIGFPPCTADACMQVLEHYGYNLAGKDVVVVGRSLVVGKPVSMMLQSANATVTMCHTRTKNLAEKCRVTDILVVATGHANTVGADAVSPGQVVIDVGINWSAETQKLCGDVDFEAVLPIVEAITPVPGGVGSVTTAILAKHTVEAAERSLVASSSQ